MHIIQENSFFGENLRNWQKNLHKYQFRQISPLDNVDDDGRAQSTRRKRHFLFRSMAAAIGFKQKLPSPISHGIHFQDTNKYYIRGRLMKNSNM